VRSLQTSAATRPRRRTNDRAHAGAATVMYQQRGAPSLLSMTLSVSSNLEPFCHHRANVQEVNVAGAIAATSALSAGLSGSAIATSPESATPAGRVHLPVVQDHTGYRGRSHGRGEPHCADRGRRAQCDWIPRRYAATSRATPAYGRAWTSSQGPGKRLLGRTAPVGSHAVLRAPTARVDEQPGIDPEWARA